jgi:hypothetical protein
MSASSLQLNRMPNGQLCPTCRDRVLDAIPPALPSRAPAPRALEPEFRSGALEDEAP